jgi:hypothetical protein
MGPFRLQFPVGDITALAAQYDFDSDDQVAAAGASARERGYYTKPELVSSASGRPCGAGAA